jgi:hypothetical protein
MFDFIVIRAHFSRTTRVLLNDGNAIIWIIYLNYTINMFVFKEQIIFIDHYSLETQSYVLNFHGRVTQASVKNFQIVHDDDRKLCCNGSPVACSANKRRRG